MLNLEALCSLSEFKNFVKIDLAETSQDTTLEGMINAASTRLKQYCGHSLRRKTYIEYHNGEDGQICLVTNEFPIVSVTSLYDDTLRVYGLDTLLDTAYYTYDPESGTIYLDGEEFCTGIRNIKVTYVAGFADFVVTGGYNDALDFEETDYDELTTYLTPGDYTEATLATELQTQLNLVGASTYTVSFSTTSQLYTITSGGTGGAGIFHINWLDGTHTANSCANLLGYSALVNDVGTLTYVGDMLAGQIPDDLRIACKMLGAHYWRMSPASGMGSIGLESEVNPRGEGTLNYDKTPIPDVVMDLVSKYRDFAI